MKEKSCQSQLQLYNFLKKKGGGGEGGIKGVITLMASEKALF